MIETGPIAEELKESLPEEGGSKGVKLEYYCTLFTKKKNRPLITFWVHTKEENAVKYMCIYKDYIGEVDKKIKENIKAYLFDKGELSEEAKDLGEKFDKKFRVLVSNK
jgi:hypothetical protein